MFSKIRKSNLITKIYLGPLGKIESRLDHNSKGLKELSVNVQVTKIGLWFTKINLLFFYGHEQYLAPAKQIH